MYRKKHTAATLSCPHGPTPLRNPESVTEPQTLSLHCLVK